MARFDLVPWGSFIRSPDEGSARLSIAAASIPEWSRGLIVGELDEPSAKRGHHTGQRLGCLGDSHAGAGPLH